MFMQEGFFYVFGFLLGKASSICRMKTLDAERSRSSFIADQVFGGGIRVMITLALRGKPQHFGDQGAQFLISLGRFELDGLVGQ